MSAPWTRRGTRTRTRRRSTIFHISKKEEEKEVSKLVAERKVLVASLFTAIIPSPLTPVAASLFPVGAANVAVEYYSVCLSVDIRVSSVSRPKSTHPPPWFHCQSAKISLSLMMETRPAHHWVLAPMMRPPTKRLVIIFHLITIPYTQSKIFLNDTSKAYIIISNLALSAPPCNRIMTTMARNAARHRWWKQAT